VLLRRLPCLIDEFAAFAGAFCKLLTLGFDLGMQTFEDCEDGAFEDLGRFGVRIGDALSEISCDLSCGGL
jgi:hypothetical protein